MKNSQIPSDCGNYLDSEDLGLEILDPYAGELNTERIKAYSDLEQFYYNVPLSVCRDIFCAGIDWYIKQLKERPNK